MEKLALRRAIVLDGSGSAPIREGSVLVERGRITYVGEDSGLVRGQLEGFTEVDCQGKSVLPGLINAHMHLHWNGWVEETPEERLVRRLVPNDMYSALLSAAQATRVALSGITTIRDLHPGPGTKYCLWAVRDAIDDNLVVGPRLVLSGRPITRAGGHGYLHAQAREITGGEDATRAVREEVRDGADVIKIFGGASRYASMQSKSERRREPFLRGVGPQLSTVEMQAVVDEAHRLGAKVAVHTHGIESIRDALSAGVDSIEHGVGLDMAAIDQMVDLGTFLVPTVEPYYLALKQSSEDEASGRPSTHRTRGGVYSWNSHQEWLPVAISKRVLIAAGTDGSGDLDPMESLQTELSLYHRFGLSVPEAIATASGNAAQLLGVSEEVGTLQPGKRADVLVVEGDASVSLNALSAIALVLKDGRVIRDSRPGQANGRTGDQAQVQGQET